MPGMDGLTAASKIKKNPLTAHIPVVMCTSHDGERYQDEAKSHGALTTLQKPPAKGRLEEVLGVLDNVLMETSMLDSVESSTSSGTTEDQQAGIRAVPDPGPTQEQVIDLMVASRVSKAFEQFESTANDKLRKELSEMLTSVERKLESRPEGMTRKEVESFVAEQLEAQNAASTRNVSSLGKKLGSEIIGSDLLTRKLQAVARQEAEVVSVSKVGETVRSTVTDVLDSVIDKKIAQLDTRLEQVRSQASGRAAGYAAMAAIVGVAAAAAGYFLGA
ncbi:MAG: response regulator, partial [Gammaproteobacteria bacterium]|nr:response regulator [Gammaproteobacteria bacterium]